MQQPPDLDTSYQFALLHEEVGASYSFPTVSNQSTRRAIALPLPPPPSKPQVSASGPRASEDKEIADSYRRSASEDKWGALRAFRKAKGLCFICGEHWGKDHLCKQEVQLHVMQEMVEFLQNTDVSKTDDIDPSASLNMISISATAMGSKSKKSVRTMQLKIQLQGHNYTFLVDSGSTQSFLHSSLQSELQVAVLMLPVPVRIANGDIVTCSSQLLNCTWYCSGYRFNSDFKFFPLGSYDGIISLDWLTSHSPMLIDWENHWMSFQHNNVNITILGAATVIPEFALVEVCSLLSTTDTPFPDEIQKNLNEFQHVFEAPKGLPPRRPYDHKIPLIPGDVPVSLRPYRMALALKTELEKKYKRCWTVELSSQAIARFHHLCLWSKRKMIPGAQ
ncbi:uncharacterized protein LOC119312788 [Triticum dicoccoides]|uniref:uncharacterized protein LOC119312788 n=1 Tax=Triticum dicoccoides TaxID=85692 RepID=UPI0018910D97|nr:uncharacterized protein LOC119312788 [Triticum dicoccoides]